MSFTHPTPEPKPWSQMSDRERIAYFRACTANQPADMSAFREALSKRRSPEHQAEREAGNVERSPGGTTS